MIFRPGGLLADRRKKYEFCITDSKDNTYSREGHE
jgi:hypothetical protein